MSLVTERLQNPKMGIFFCGKKWILLCETKLIAAAERNRCVWTQAELVMVTKRCDCMLTVLAGEHPSYCWIMWEVLFQTSLLFWKIPFRKQNQFLFHHCMDQLKSDLLPSCPGEIIALHNFSCLLCSGRKCKTMALGRILLQDTLVPQWLMRCNKNIHAPVYITCVCWIDIFLWRACVCQKYIYTHLLCDRVKWIEEWVLFLRRCL